MPISELVLRFVPLPLIVVAGVFAVWDVWRVRRLKARGRWVAQGYPGSRDQAGDLGLVWWRSLSAERQAAYDAAQIEQAATAAAEDAARLAVERATDINSLFRP